LSAFGRELQRSRAGKEKKKCGGSFKKGRGCKLTNAGDSGQRGEKEGEQTQIGGTVCKKSIREAEGSRAVEQRKGKGRSAETLGHLEKGDIVKGLHPKDRHGPLGVLSTKGAAQERTPEA